MLGCQGGACIHKRLKGMLGMHDGLHNLLAQHNGRQALAEAVAQNADVIVFLLVQDIDLILLYVLGALILLACAAVEDLDVDDCALDSRRYLEGGVFNILCLVAEDGPEQLFLRRQQGLALGRNLADQDVVSLD